MAFVGITVQYKEGESDDTVPPVIRYNGPTHLGFKEGEIFSLDGMSAFDEYDNAPATLSYEWSAVLSTSAADCLTVSTL